MLGLGVSAGFGLVLTLAGCSSLTADSGGGRAVSLAEFSQPAPPGMILGSTPMLAAADRGDVKVSEADLAGAGTSPTETTIDGAPAGAAPSSGSGASAKPVTRSAPVSAPVSAIGSEARNSAASPTNPVSAATRATAIQPTDGDVWIVDALVGQVNGRPVFAQEFLEPIEARLIQLSRSNDRVAGWRQAQGILEARFEDFINSELIISEAESQLTPEQQQGFFGWLKSLQEGTIAEYSGSREEARERMQEDLGMDIEEFIQQRRDASLVQYLLDRKVKPRTIVAWRDVEREYLARDAEFNPPAMVVIGRIAVNGRSEPEKLAQVRAWIAEGKQFRDIAEALKLEKGGMLTQIPVKPGEDAAAAIASTADLTTVAKENLRGVTPGGVGAPIERGDTVTWLGIAEVKQDPPRSLYDPAVQIQLKAELDGMRGGFERSRYISRLRSRWVSDDITRIEARLKEIALERYWKQ
jgi:hypothetical protein